MATGEYVGGGVLDTATKQRIERACGSAEVATDLARRSASLYAEASPSPDPGILDSIAHAVDALAVVVEAMRGQLAPSSLGPAA